MSETPTPTRAPHPRLADVPSRSVEASKHELARILAAKVEQGYEIESQTASEAILVTRGRRRWLGLRGHEPSARQRIAFDEDGRLTTRKHSP